MVEAIVAEIPPQVELSEDPDQQGRQLIEASLQTLITQTNKMFEVADQVEESKGWNQGEEYVQEDSLMQRWSKEALLVVTQHLTEQQKISLLSEQLTLLTYQPQEATNDDVNFKQELRQICDQLTFEVEQKELAVLAAPTRLQQKRQAVEAVFNKFRNEIMQVEQGFMKPQIDRDIEEEEDEKQSALAVFTEGYTKFIEQNQNELDDIENQQITFREGKKELIESIRSLINDFKQSVRSTGTVMSLGYMFRKKYHLTKTWGLTDQSLIRGSLIWPEEKDFAHLPQQQLKDVQLARISYYKVGSILSMQFHLTNGMTSPYAGNSGLNKCESQVVLIGNQPVRKIRIKASKNWVNEIRFLTEDDHTVGEVKADSGVGEWHDIVLEKGERIIGFQEDHDNEQYVRRFGFVTIKP